MKARNNFSFKILLLACMLALVAGGWSSNWSSRAAESSDTISIPGELSEENNVVFSQDGRIGLVATYKEMDGKAGHSLYSFDANSGTLLSRFETFPSGINPTKLKLSAG